MEFKKTNKEYFKDYGKVMIFKSFFNSLMSVADRIVAGTFIGSSALVATTLVSPLMFIIASVALLFVSGMGSYVGLLIGRGEREKVSSMVSGLLVIMFFVAIGLMLPGYLFTEKIAYLLGARGDYLELAKEYLKILSIAFPFIMLAKTLDVLILNDGSPKYSFGVNIIGTISNLFINIISIVVFDMGVGGLAFATLLSSLIQFLLGVYYFAKKSKVIKIGKATFEIKRIGRVLYNGLSDFSLVATESLMIYVVNMAFVKYLSPVEFEAYAIVNILVTLFYSIFMGNSFGLQPIYSQMFGAKVFGRLNSLLNYSVKVSSTYSLTLFLVLIPFLTMVFSLFTNDFEVIKVAKTFYFTYAFAILFSNYPLQTTYFFTAINRPLESMGISLLRSLVLIPILTYMFIMNFGVVGLAMAYIISDLLISFIVYIYLKRIDYKSLKVIY